MELDPILRLSDAARSRVAEVRSSEADPETLALWVEVTGESAGEYTYDMWFQAAADASPDDAVQHADDLTIVIAASSVDKIRGATLDLSDDVAHAGMAILNPNHPAPPAAPAR